MCIALFRFGDSYDCTEMGYWLFRTAERVDEAQQNEGKDQLKLPHSSCAFKQNSRTVTDEKWSVFVESVTPEAQTNKSGRDDASRRLEMKNGIKLSRARLSRFRVGRKMKMSA
ncbi:hypothetical protein J6590_044110 [Homalodisca vitripennis]|nr:hypothetical protein J6590_044110 [Homalodisca vitripennis]